MADTGWLSPTSAAESGTAWANENNIFSSNNIYATLATTATGTYPTLWGYGFDFSGIPSGATIDGIEVTVEHVGSANTNIQITRVQLFDNTTAKGSDKEVGTAVTTTEVTLTYGASNDTWDWIGISDVDFDATFRVGIEYTIGTNQSQDKRRNR